MPICTRPCCRLYVASSAAKASSLVCHCGAPMSRMAVVLLTSGGSQHTWDLLNPGTFIVGRQSSSLSVEPPDIDLGPHLHDSRAVSRRHARLIWYGDDRLRIARESTQMDLSVNGVSLGHGMGLDCSFPVHLTLAGTVQLTIEQEP